MDRIHHIPGGVRGAAPEHVVVVGAGMLGLATAHFLVRAGVRVSIVDQCGVASGSSWGNAGWVAPAITLPLTDPATFRHGWTTLTSPTSPIFLPLTPDPRLWRFLATFARNCTRSRWQRAVEVLVRAGSEALDAFADMSDAIGARSPHLQVADPLLIAFDRADARSLLVHELDEVARIGGKISYERLDGAAVRTVEPALSERARFGIALKDQHFLDPGAFLSSLAGSLERAGVRFVLNAEVTNVVESRDRITVRTRDMSLPADAVVLANGSWAGRFARQHGVKSMIQAGRGYSFSVTPETPISNPVYLPAQRIALTPMSGGQLRVAGMMEFRGPDAPLDRRRVDTIVKAAQPFFPDVDWDLRTAEWVGARPCTADGLPMVGRTGSSRVFIAGGHGMWGITLGPLSGKLLASLITGDGRHPLLRDLDPLRRTVVHPRSAAPRGNT